MQPSRDKFQFEMSVCEFGIGLLPFWNGSENSSTDIQQRSFSGHISATIWQTRQKTIKKHVDFSAARDDGTGDDDKRDSKPREKLRRHQHTNQHLVYFVDVLLRSTNSVKALQANRWKDTALYRRLISVEGNKRCQQLINTVYWEKHQHWMLPTLYSRYSRPTIQSTPAVYGNNSTIMYIHYFIISVAVLSIKTAGI